MHDEKIVKRIAEERIGRLLELAHQDAAKSNHDSGQLGKRYVKLAREISSHYKVSMSKKEKGSFCKGCNSALVPGKTCSVVIASSRGYTIYRCACGTDTKIFYK